jgi:hypothetical protein
MDAEAYESQTFDECELVALLYTVHCTMLEDLPNMIMLPSHPVILLHVHAFSQLQFHESNLCSVGGMGTSV